MVLTRNRGSVTRKFPCCTGVKEHDSGDIIKYHCPNCQLAHGPSKWKVRTNWHRHDYSDPLADGKKVQSGTHVFVQELKNRKFRSGHEVTSTLPAHQVTVEYLKETSFMNPILVPEKDDLGLMLPPDDLTIGDIVDFLGAELMIDVIDVLKQESIKMTLGEFAEYYTSYNRTKVFNVVSLEFTEMGLSEYVRPPTLVSRISWVENCWPKNIKRMNNNPKPAVMKYCLIGTENSYTDFHIDFGGSSVWYHVLQGEKVFYLIRPTEDNLVKYERWMANKDQSEIFLGDEVDACFRLALQAGQTLFIPTGWIHAVLTTTDSIVFGGNFLHSFNIGLQLSVYEMEQRLNCPTKFMFPSFETLNWFAASSVIQELKEHSTRPPMYLVNGAKALCSVLRRWTQGPQSSIEAVPNTINVPKLMKDLTKEVKFAEKKTGKKRGRKENVLEQEAPQPLKLNLKSPAVGMYDFSSDDDERLVVEENRPTLVTTLPSISSFGKKPKKIQSTSKGGGLKLRLSIGSGSSGNAQRSKKIGGLNMAGGNSDTDDLGSPEPEQEAIQGMLSMSGTFNFGGGTTVSHDEAKRSRTSGNLEKLKERLKAKRATSSGTHFDEEEDEFERALKNCKPDDDFIYLGIDANDEDTKIFKKRGKTRGPQRHDEAWNPKGVSLKGLLKEERPQREGVKREVMESTLAESRKFTGPPTTPPSAKERREPVKKKTPAPRIKEESSTEPRARRTGKKGMATAKQRLGKILKIHKMRH